MKTLWGIDLGGTKIEGIILKDNSKLEIIERIRIPTDAHHGYQHIIDQIVELVELLKSKSGHSPTMLGLGTPGAIDIKTQTIKNSNTICLIGQPIKTDLEARLKIPVEIENDANLFALAETHYGVVQDLDQTPQTVFGVIMGTGVGGGIVINGKLLKGLHHVAGEWGHNYLTKSGGKCYCQKTGCVETVISGPATERYYQSLTGTSLKLEQIYKLAQSGDPDSTKTINRLLHFFAKAIASIINILDPDVIIIGGGVGNIDALYTEGRELTCDYIFNDQLDTLFLQPKLGDSAGVLGAALLTKN